MSITNIIITFVITIIIDMTFTHIIITIIIDMTITNIIITLIITNILDMTNIMFYRWYLTRETFDDTFEWDIKSITIFASSVVLFISSC